MQALFLDFDGVVVDSIDECYLISKDAFLDCSGIEIENEDFHKEYFYRFRGLVKPAHEYVYLHEAIHEAFLRTDQGGIPEIFDAKKNAENNPLEQEFERLFFEKRKTLQNDLQKWFSLNPLTEFGKYLQGRKLPLHFIVTTKNKEAVRLLLDHYKIEIQEIYDKDSCNKEGGKGVVISKILDEKNLHSAVFVDDVVGHLDTVRDRRVQCYFADWGYGNNQKYPLYAKQKWGREL